MKLIRLVVLANNSPPSLILTSSMAFVAQGIVMTVVVCLCKLLIILHRLVVFYM